MLSVQVAGFDQPWSQASRSKRTSQWPIGCFFCRLAVERPDRYTITVKLIVFPALVLLVVGSAVFSADHPNVLFIVTDDQGYGDVGIHGNKLIDTPHLDSIAKAGLQLEKFHVCPNCAPTRASLLTGRYHYRTGVSSVSRGEEVMRSTETTLAEVFRDHGYATGCFGKWHNGSNWPHNAIGQGFDEFFGLSQGHWNQYFDAELESNDRFEKTEGFVTDVLTDRAMEFMKSRHEGDQPFFCYVPFNTPHSPFQCPDGLFEKYKARKLDDRTAAIYAMVESIDLNVGRMLGLLSELKTEKETIVVYLSDNGPSVNKKAGTPRFNGHFYGAKGSVHEGGVRVPCFIKWPEKIAANSKFRRMTAHIDILPTLVDLCSLKNFDPDIEIDGKSLEEVLLTGGNPRRWPNRILFTSQTPAGYDVKNANVAVRTDRWLAVRDVRWRRWKTDPMLGGWELYDLSSDPFQTVDVASDYPFLLSDMRADFSFWMDDTTDDGLGLFRTEIGHDEWPVVTLRAQDAVLSDEDWKLKRGNNSWIADWKSSAQSISWPVKVVDLGTYAVSIDYFLKGENAPCQFELRGGDEKLVFEVKNPHVGEPIKDLDRSPRNEFPAKVWKRMEIGEIHLKSDIETLLLTPIKLKSEAIELKNLILRNTRIETAPTEKNRE